jgi:hypothetical protein
MRTYGFDTLQSLLIECAKSGPQIFLDSCLYWIPEQVKSERGKTLEIGTKDVCNFYLVPNETIQ